MNKTAKKIFDKIESTQKLVDQMGSIGREVLFPRDDWGDNTDLYTRFNTTLDYAEEDCEKVFNFWVSKEKNHNGSYALGIWRNHPNIYCTAGRPSRTQEQIKEIIEGSETEKHLFDEGVLSIYWVRNGLNPNFPSKTSWGHKFNFPTIQIRKDGEVIFETKENTYQKKCKHELSDWFNAYDSNEEYVPSEFRNLDEEEIELRERLIELRGF